MLVAALTNCRHEKLQAFGDALLHGIVAQTQPTADFPMGQALHRPHDEGFSAGAGQRCYHPEKPRKLLTVRGVNFGGHAIRHETEMVQLPDAPGRRSYEDALRWDETTGWTPHGAPLASRFLFASSFPVQHPADALRAFRRLKLSPETERMVLYRNAAKLLGLPDTGH